MKRKRASWSRGCLNLIMIANIIMVMFVTGIYVLMTRPSLGANGADVLRMFIGDQAVSDLEMGLFQIQDLSLHFSYATGLVTPGAPWRPASPARTQSTQPTAVSANTQTQDVSPEARVVTPVPSSIPAALPTPSVSPPDWQPSPATPLGSLPGEGVWTPYIQDFTGRTVAYRTYIQPDPTRPYAVVGVVAFSPVRTRLHFVLGSVEPYSPNAPKRTGAMLPADKTPGVLLAMFNGGFKARNGQYGAMADGITALPPRTGLGTIAIYRDGSLGLGEWGSEIQLTPDMVAWRQNGPLVIHQGVINSRIYDNLPQDWGYTVTDTSPTWRSALGLSADGQTYYYLCGSSLSMKTLARSMLAVGIYNGMQLDINAYWVNFVAIKTDGQQLGAQALFPDMMKENIDRYLSPYERDFFYVTISGKS